MALTVAQGIHQLNSIISSAYLIRSNGVAVLVDTGYWLERYSIAQQLRRLLGKDGRLDAILLTHAHPDHDGNANYFSQKFGGVVIMNKAEQNYASTHNRVDLERMKFLGFPNSFIFRLVTLLTPKIIVQNPIFVVDGDSCFGLEVISTPGHTPGSTCYLHTATQTLFTGDTIINAMPPWTFRKGLQLPAKAYSCDYTLALESVEKIASTIFSNICTGHGRAILGDADLKIRKFLTT